MATAGLLLFGVLVSLMSFLPAAVALIGLTYYAAAAPACLTALAAFLSRGLPRTSTLWIAVAAGAATSPVLSSFAGRDHYMHSGGFALLLALGGGSAAAFGHWISYDWPFPSRASPPDRPRA